MEKMTWTGTPVFPQTALGTVIETAGVRPQEECRMVLIATAGIAASQMRRSMHAEAHLATVIGY